MIKTVTLHDGKNIVGPCPPPGLGDNYYVTFEAGRGYVLHSRDEYGEWETFLVDGKEVWRRVEKKRGPLTLLKTLAVKFLHIRRK